MAGDRMSLDVATERSLMAAIHASIKNEETDFEVAVESLSDPAALSAACARATDLVALILLQQASGTPDAESIQRVAESASAFNLWSGITQEEFSAYIEAVFNKTPTDTVLPFGPAVRAPFILTAHLVSAFRSENETWHAYLDRLWDVLEGERS